MELELSGCRIRSWRPGDAESLARHADNRKIWLKVRDHFPHPYTLRDAEEWIARARELTPETQFAIEVEGQAAGGIGLFLQEDVARRSAEIGYWLGETYWGRGIATAAVRRFTVWALDAFDLLRIYALVFDGNPGSCRVLEKSGYVLEGRMQKAVVKEGRVLDQLIYAITA